MIARKLQGLRRLLAENIRISNNGAEAIAKGLKNLVYLNLGKNLSEIEHNDNITDLGIKAIAEGLGELNELDIRTIEVTESSTMESPKWESL